MKKAVKASGKRGANRGSSSTSGTKQQPRAGRAAPARAGAATDNKRGQTRFAESAGDAFQRGY